MHIPIKSDDDDLRAWMFAPRSGLMSHEIARIIEISPCSIRDAIRTGELSGVRLRAYGKVFGYAATVEHVAKFYEVPKETLNHLRDCLSSDIEEENPFMGQLENYTGTDWKIKTEFETAKEFRAENQ